MINNLNINNNRHSHCDVTLFLVMSQLVGTCFISASSCLKIDTAIENDLRCDVMRGTWSFFKRNCIAK